MTTKQHENQDKHRGRAVWLARLPSQRSHTKERHQDRRATDVQLAWSYGADITGEFLISSGEDEHLPEHVWAEVLDFLRHMHADQLVVLAPGENAAGFKDYCHRTEELEAAGVQLVLPQAAALLRPDALVRSRKKAA